MNGRLPVTRSTSSLVDTSGKGRVCGRARGFSLWHVLCSFTLTVTSFTSLFSQILGTSILRRSVPVLRQK